MRKKLLFLSFLLSLGLFTGACQDLGEHSPEKDDKKKEKQENKKEKQEEENKEEEEYHGEHS